MMTLYRDDRKNRIAAAKWHFTHVFIPQQEPEGWRHDLEAMKRDAKERGERYSTVTRYIKAGGREVKAIVLLVGPKEPMQPVWIGHLEQRYSFEILTTGADDSSAKREHLAEHPIDPTVVGRRTWPDWLLAVRAVHGA